jgi:hypothetical protein
MSECVKKLFNRKREKLFEKEFEEHKRNAKVFIDTHPNSPGIKYLKKTLKNMNLKKAKQKRIDNYRKTMCNPTCKGKLFESGDPNKLPPSFLKELKKDMKDLTVFTLKDGIEHNLALRKEIFGKKKNVLKNGFYEKLDAETVKNLKKRGATSGCYRGGIDGYDLIRPLL